MRTMILLLCIALAGCTTVQIPSYIQSEHPYQKKMYGDFNAIVFAVRDVLTKNGWKIKTITNPAIYERIQEGDENSNILIFTEIKESSMLVSSNYTHLNVMILAVADGADVQIRYGKLTQVPFKQFKSTRNDKLGELLLQQIEQKILETK